MKYMHKEHIRGLIGITLTSALAFGVAFGVKGMQGEEEVYHGIQLKGRVESHDSAANGAIQSVAKVVEDNGEVSGYVVTVKETGYGGEMLIDVALNTDGTKILGVHVGENQETEGIGSAITEKEFLEQFQGMTTPAYMDGVTTTSAGSQKIKKDVNEMKLKDGEYIAKAKEADDNGFTEQVSIKVEDGKITSIIWDCVKEDGTTKRKLADHGEYVMTEDGLTWTEQANALAETVIKNQSVESIGMNEQGKTDAVAGVSIYIGNFVNLLEDSLSQAEVKENIVLNDGDYIAKASQADDNGFVEQLKMTVKDGKITSVDWDCVKEDGTTKSKLSQEGQYVMTEDGLTWAEQAKALAETVIKNQSVESVGMNEQGKTDTVAGVSIYIGGFVNLAEDCLKQAGAVKEETPQEGTKIDAVSGATISSKAVARAIDKAYVFVLEMK